MDDLEREINNVDFGDKQTKMEWENFTKNSNTLKSKVSNYSSFNQLGANFFS